MNRNIIVLFILWIGVSDSSIVIAQTDEGSDHHDAVIPESRVPLVQETLKANAFWPDDIAAYCRAYDTLIGGIRINAKHPDDLYILEKIVASVLAKDEPKALQPHVSSMLLGLQKDAFQDLLDTARKIHASGEDRIRCARLAAWFLNAVSKNIIPNYKPRRTLRNVVPPIVTGPIMAGMNPREIADPIARKAYEEAIQVNAANAVVNARQRDLSAITKILKMTLVGFLNDTDREFDETHEQVSNIIGEIMDNTNASDGLDHPLRR